MLQQQFALAIQTGDTMLMAESVYCCLVTLGNLAFKTMFHYSKYMVS